MTARRTGYVNSSLVHLAERMLAFARDTERGMLVLDAGAGRSPYKPLFAHARYEAADFAQLGTDYAPLDYVCDLSEIPVEDERFDRIIFNQVLEHIPAPRRVLAELYRVIKPGGLILCSCPLYFPEHQRPYDYFRYTQYALRLLFEGAGFRLRSLDWLEGYFGTVGYQLLQMHRNLPGSARVVTTGWRRVYLQPMLSLTRLLSRPLATAFARADVRWHYEGRGMPKNYVVIAEKPLAPTAQA
jgi:SAM-dependent methyltransferase